MAIDEKAFNKAFAKWQTVAQNDMPVPLRHCQMDTGFCMPLYRQVVEAYEAAKTEQPSDTAKHLQSVKEALETAAQANLGFQAIPYALTHLAKSVLTEHIPALERAFGQLSLANPDQPTIHPEGIIHGEGRIEVKET